MISFFFSANKFLKNFEVQKGDLFASSHFEEYMTIQFIEIDGVKTFFNHVFTDTTIDFIPPCDITYDDSECPYKQLLISVENIDEALITSYKFKISSLMMLTSLFDLINTREYLTILGYYQDDNDTKSDIVLKFNEKEEIVLLNFSEVLEDSNESRYRMTNLIDTSYVTSFNMFEQKPCQTFSIAGTREKYMPLEVDSFFKITDIGLKEHGNAPSGRTQEQHDRIMLFNQKRRKF